VPIGPSLLPRLTLHRLILTCFGVRLVPILGKVGEGDGHPLAPHPAPPILLDPGFCPEDGMGVDDAEVGVGRSGQGQVSAGNGKVPSGDAILISGPGRRQQDCDVTELGLRDVIEPFRY
jgi:hypothetical protein